MATDSTTPAKLSLSAIEALYAEHSIPFYPESQVDKQAREKALGSGGLGLISHECPDGKTRQFGSMIRLTEPGDEDEANERYFRVEHVERTPGLPGYPAGAFSGKVKMLLEVNALGQPKADAPLLAAKFIDHKYGLSEALGIAISSKQQLEDMLRTFEVLAPLDAQIQAFHAAVKAKGVEVKFDWGAVNSFLREVIVNPTEDSLALHQGIVSAILQKGTCFSVARAHLQKLQAREPLMGFKEVWGQQIADPGCPGFVFQRSGQTVAVSPWRFGKSVSQWMRDKGAPLTNAEKASIVRQSLSALVKLHKQKIVCADFKPGNMIYDRDSDRLYLVDFGSMHSKTLRDSLGDNVRLDSVTVTGSYISEDAHNEVVQRRKPPADVVSQYEDGHAFAITAIRLFREEFGLIESSDEATGRFVHAERPDSDEEVLDAHAKLFALVDEMISTKVDFPGLASFEARIQVACDAIAALPEVGLSPETVELDEGSGAGAEGPASLFDGLGGDSDAAAENEEESGGDFSSLLSDGEEGSSLPVAAKLETSAATVEPMLVPPGRPATPLLQNTLFVRPNTRSASGSNAGEPVLKQVRLR